MLLTCCYATPPPGYVKPPEVDRVSFERTRTWTWELIPCFGCNLFWMSMTRAVCVYLRGRKCVLTLSGNVGKWWKWYGERCGHLKKLSKMYDSIHEIKVVLQKQCKKLELWTRCGKVNKFHVCKEKRNIFECSLSKLIKG